MIILIADSGSTKADWVAVDKNGEVLAQFSTMGFNPYFHSSDKVESELKGAEAMIAIAEKIDKTYFYGCLLYTSPSPRDLSTSRMPSSA